MRVPEGWQETTLGELAEIVGGSTPSKSEPAFWENGRISWATPSDITCLTLGHTRLSRTSEKITEEAVKKTSLRVLPPGSLLMTSRATIGYAAINTIPMSTNQGFACFLPNARYDTDFLLNWIFHQRDILKRHAGGSTFPEISKKTLRGLTICLPPLSEQRRIAEILSSVDNNITAVQAVLQQTRTVKRSVLERVLTKGIGHTRFKQTEFGLIPEGWEVVPLRTVAHVQTGVAKGKKDIQDPVELPYLRVANVQDGHIDLTELKTIAVSASHVERYSLRSGDVLMTEGGDFDKLGRGDVWKGQVPVCLHQNHVFAVRPNPDFLVSEFLAALTASAHGKGYFLGCAKRTTNLASINSTQVKDFPVLLPGKEEQERIVQQVAAYSLAERSASDALAQLEKTKAALLSDLLTGRKRVSADALSPAL